MSTITVLAPVRVAVPRVTELAATTFLRVLSWFQRGGTARAERRLLVDRGAEAAAVREYAQSFARHDPRFAADLLAAADRHERTE